MIGSARQHSTIVVQMIRELQHRLVRPILMVFSVFVIGTVGYVVIGEGRWSWLDAAYMTSITLTTVGYGEVLPQMDENTRVFTILLMWSGMAVTLFAISEVTAFVVDRNLGLLWRERKMEVKIRDLRDHYIICGAGSTGLHIVEEFFLTKRNMVVIERDSERVELLHEQFPGILIVQGDATDETTLAQAGIDHARGLIANVNKDSQNLLITVQVNFSHPNCMVVSRVEDPDLNEKFIRAGANYVVNPSKIGGLRMASQMIRPETVTFLDKMLRGQDVSMRVDEAVIQPGSVLDGRKLVESGIFERTGLRAIALKPPGEVAYHYNPVGEEVLVAGTTIIVVAAPDQLQSLREMCREAPKAEEPMLSATIPAGGEPA